MRLFEVIYRALTLRRRRREEAIAKRLRVSPLTYARIQSIRERTESYRVPQYAPLPTFSPDIPVVLYDPYKDQAPRFEGKGGESGGAGASVTLDTPLTAKYDGVADVCGDVQAAPPTCSE